MSIRLTLLLLGVLSASCAAGQESPPPARERYRRPEPGPLDGSTPDRPVDLAFWWDRAVDRSIADRVAGDRSAPDSPKPCPDGFEPNNSCAASAAAGSVTEGAGWAGAAGALYPSTDLDWLALEAKEKSHTCVPFTSQCFVFLLRLQVPTGRVFRVCLQKNDCGGSPTCVDNQSQPGPKALDLQYTVSGTCALNDDTSARLSIKALDGQAACAPYTLSFRYDEC